MILSIVILLLITYAGFALTSSFDRDSLPLERLCKGNVVGFAFFGLIIFLIACFFGLSIPTIIGSSAILFVAIFLLGVLLPKQILTNPFGEFRKMRFSLVGFGYYFFIFLILYFFFERAMIEKNGAIFTGATQNFGDLPFHLGAIFSFTEGQNFPPENPSFANAKFTYPFMADLVAACFVKLGAGVREAMLLQNVTLGFSLAVILESFVARLTQSRFAGKIAAMLLLFGGGFGFVLFFRDYLNDGRSFVEFIWNLKRDYTISDGIFRWGNSLIVLFVTQRSLLFGMPIALIVLTKLWEIFTAETQRRGDFSAKDLSTEETGAKEFGTKEFANKDFSTKDFGANETNLLRVSVSPRLRVAFFSGFLAGTLPLIHVHSLAVLFVVTAFLFFLRRSKWREWIAFGVGVCVIALPELIWSLSGSATSLSKFIEWHFGWDKRGNSFLFFWFANLGLFISLLVFGLLKTYFASQTKGQELTAETGNKPPKPANILLFYLPFLFCFIVPNILKLAPWEWDNIKVLIYWFIGSLPFVALLLAETWKENAFWKFVVVSAFAALIASGAIDVWRVCSRQINYEVFNKDSVTIAEQLRQKADPRSLFLNAPTYNSPVALSGRRSLMRYSGHLASYGIDYEVRESEVKRIYEGTALANGLLRKYGVNYVLIGPEEKDGLRINENFFAKYPIVVEVGEYRVYKIN